MFFVKALQRWGTKCVVPHLCKSANNDPVIIFTQSTNKTIISISELNFKIFNFSFAFPFSVIVVLLRCTGPISFTDHRTSTVTFAFHNYNLLFSPLSCSLLSDKCFISLYMSINAVIRHCHHSCHLSFSQQCFNKF